MHLHVVGLFALFCFSGDGLYIFYIQQKTGNAIRALGRMKNSLQKLMKPGTSPGAASGDSLSSASGVGSSSSSSSLSSMGSQSTLTDAINDSIPFKVNTTEDISLANQNGGKFESTNHENEHKNSRLNPASEVKERKSNLNGQNVDINLNLTSGNKSAFVKTRDEIKQTVNTQNPANLCFESIREKSSNQNEREDSKTKHPLKFTKQMVDSKAFPGDVVRFDVEFTADNNTNVLWYFEDEPLTQDEHHCIQQSKGICSLIIKDVCEDDDGEYTCTITNKTSEESCSAELIVYGAL